MNDSESSNALPFRLITVAIVFGLTLPLLIQDGMFMDAMLYTSVAHNLSQGIGTFWFPQFSVHNIAGLPSFHEQPPLIIGIQALLFKAFGSSMYVERVYTFLMLVLTAFLIHRFWKLVFRENAALRSLSWLPVLSWIILPTTFWSYTNNMLENSMGVFTLLATLVLVRSFTGSALSSNALLAGCLVFLATLSKGIPGLFPLAVPAIYALTTRNISWSKAARMTAIMFGVVLSVYLLLLAVPTSRESLTIYFVKRALHRIQDVPTVTNRFYTLTHLFIELLPQLVLVALLAWRGLLRNTSAAHFRLALFFALTGLAASAPLMLTLVQKSFYYVPALPFFGMAMAVLFAPVVATWVQKIRRGTQAWRRWIFAGTFLLVGVFVLTSFQAGKAKRDRDLLHDIYLMGEKIPAHSLVSIYDSMLNEWDLQCYMIRYFHISVETGFRNAYCIRDSELEPLPPAGYQKVDIPTERYHLYKRN